MEIDEKPESYLTHSTGKSLEAVSETYALTFRTHSEQGFHEGAGIGGLWLI